MKRFTDTLKWSDPWFRRLSHQGKLLWFYLVELKDRVQLLDDGKIFLPKFIPFQYGTLSENCVPHKKVIEAAKFHSLTQTFKGYAYPSHRVGATLPCRVV